jgi:hypothetical protein
LEVFRKQSLLATQGSAVTAVPKITSESVADLFAGVVTRSHLWFDASSGVISINTQARRLGCFIYLLGQIARGKRIESLLLALSSQEVAILKRNIEDSGITSGYLTTKSSSVKHYLDAAIELRLLSKQGSVFSLTRRGRFLVEAVRPDLEAPYPLTREARVFFLHTLLETDYFGALAIVRSLLDGTRKLSAIQRDHRSQLLHVLGDASQRAGNERLHRLAQDRIILIQHWKKPESYSEHLVAAKLNWLADLGILENVPSIKSDILINKEHEQWLHNFYGVVSPTESDLLAFVLNFCRAIGFGSHSPEKRQICGALDSAFCLLGSQGSLKKIRCNDFILFLLCFHASMLIDYIDNEKSLLKDSAIRCGDLEYRFHIASRPTQSYIICVTKEGG